METKNPGRNLGAGPKLGMRGAPFRERVSQNGKEGCSVEDTSFGVGRPKVHVPALPITSFDFFTKPGPPACSLNSTRGHACFAGWSIAVGTMAALQSAQ